MTDLEELSFRYMLLSSYLMKVK